MKKVDRACEREIDNIVNLLILIKEHCVENKLNANEVCAALGAMMAYCVMQTEENYTFISFWNSFYLTYSENYEGPCKHTQSESIQPFMKDKQ